MKLDADARAAAFSKIEQQGAIYLGPYGDHQIKETSYLVGSSFYRQAMTYAGVDQRAFRRTPFFAFGPDYGVYDYEQNPLDDAKLKELSPYFMRFPELEELEFSGCKQISDAGILTIPKLPNLKSIRVGGTSITERGISQFRQRFPSVKIYR